MRALLLIALLLRPSVVFAYVGPGAGFAFAGSAFFFLVTIGMAVTTLLFWPVQWLWRRVRGKGLSARARARRVVIVGLDGLSPDLVERYIGEGKLPNFAALKNEGSFSRLQSTLPPISPVAWSTFQTGVNPGAHNIFDFLTLDKRLCLPQLSSARTNGGGRELKIGNFRLPLAGGSVELLRKSQPFWKILGKHGIFSTILRVPISYPPEKFNGNVLAAMCVPDLNGTQGTFSLYTDDASVTGSQKTGGQSRPVSKSGRRIEAVLTGPANPYRRDGRPLTLPFTVTVDEGRQEALLEIGRERIPLKLNTFSPWIELHFKCGWRRVSGIARFCLRQVTPHFSLYVSPINIHPEKPALPLSHPMFFSSYLAKRHGLYGTLGLLEDTWGRNEHALTDQLFLDQTWDAHGEREAMFFDALDKTRSGVCACVFDASDRIQHIFWRYLDQQHPGLRNSDPAFARVIPEMYERMDELVGRVRKKLKPDDVLIVLSDHGFTSFRRCVDINAWLQQQGYLAVKSNGTAGAGYLQDIDWSKTKAFAMGLTGIFINRAGREAHGIVSDEEVPALRNELIGKLVELKDPESGERAIANAYDTSRAYRGIYKDNACDIVVSYAKGYRVSWDAVTGAVGKTIFADNMKAWSGDHDVDPSLVPGILFCNRALNVSDPHIMDIAPTVLDLFAVSVPGYMEGKILF